MIEKKKITFSEIANLDNELFSPIELPLEKQELIINYIQNGKTEGMAIAITGKTILDGTKIISTIKKYVNGTLISNKLIPYKSLSEEEKNQINNIEFDFYDFTNANISDYFETLNQNFNVKKKKEHND